jgi:membrane protease YdiL (CAAX protease family)
MELTNDPLIPDVFKEQEVSSPSPASLPAFAFIPDSWAKNGRILLDRYFERERFSPVLMVVVVAFLLFMLFQIIGAVVAIVLILPKLGNPPDMAKMMKLLNDDIASQLIGNTVGQFLGLALPIWFLTKFHTSQPRDFLRLRHFDVMTIFWAVVGLVVLYPVIVASGMLNAAIPVPSGFQEMDKMREELIKTMLMKSNVFFNFLAIAVTPAICEELMFRGYILRQLERKRNAVVAIIMTGVIFGMYHLSFAQVLPLSLIGIYLCYLTWKTGSIYPAMAVHLVNNGISVVAGSIYAKDKNFDPSALDKMPGPWYGIVFSVIISAFLFIGIRNLMIRANQRKLDSINPINEELYEREPTI